MHRLKNYSETGAYAVYIYKDLFVIFLFSARLTPIRNSTVNL